ncbi:MAG TPA: DUF4186 domain-containing protein [Pyrinomonadaceae bacterium]|jgi:predicted Fe-S protein YdhL (DUF1289 family)
MEERVRDDDSVNASDASGVSGVSRRKPEEVFAALAASPFRRRFNLRGKELEYLRRKGLSVVLEHAADFVEKRLAPASPARDGKQTPMRHHPVFIAQHATATCCRGCLQKWHGIPKGRALEATEKAYVLEVIKTWLAREEELNAETT